MRSEWVRGWILGALIVLVPSLSCALSPVTSEPAAARSSTPEPRAFFFALSVADAEASVSWYEQVFGFELARAVDLEERGIAIRLMKREGAVLELIQDAAAQSLSALAPNLEKRYLAHGVFKFGFVVNELDTMLARLEALEIPLRGKVVTEADGSMRSLQVEDPDGNVIQVFELLAGS